MHYFSNLLRLLQIEREEDRRSFTALTRTLPVAVRRENGMSWYPVAIRDTEIGRGDYLTVELERTTHPDLAHQFRFGMTAALFSNHAPAEDRIEGTVTYVGASRLKLALRTDELPDWTRSGKLGVDAVFDENSYAEMEAALRRSGELLEKNSEGRLVRVLTGAERPSFTGPVPFRHPALNVFQQEAVGKILAAEDLAIVHGPPGTGKTTTLVQAIAALSKQEGRAILVTTPSNAAVDLLSERLSAAGLRVVRVGNPARVSEQLLALTLDQQMAGHAQMKEVRRLKKRAAEFRDLAHKYKRNFGREEREQRKALFAEARAIRNEVEKTEQYIADDLLSKAQVVTATLVGCNHYSVRQLRYNTVVIDEAGQALEPACWIPVLKGRRLVMAGDHLQLPPTIKSAEAAREGLAQTLLEKAVALHPEAVVLLQEQYRMNTAIMDFPSREFYGGKLVAAPEAAHRLLAEGEVPLQFIDTAGCGYEERVESAAISNPEEAAFLVRQLERLVERLAPLFPPGELPSIGVVAPYRHQVEVLKELVAATPSLQLSAGRLNVNTIDSFQGQERDAIFISLTRSNADSTIGFLSELRRMNVAMTRARKKLVVIGDSSTLSQHPFYADFIAYAQDTGGYLSAWELME